MDECKVVSTPMNHKEKLLKDDDGAEKTNEEHYIRVKRNHLPFNEWGVSNPGKLYHSFGPFKNLYIRIKSKHLSTNMR